VKRPRLEEFRAKRDALFRNPTLEAATAHWHEYGFPPPVRPDAPLAMIHWARQQWLEATSEMLAESHQWLKDNGYLRTMRGPAPLTPATRDYWRLRQGMGPLWKR
jgi:hypothetical protein